MRRAQIWRPGKGTISLAQGKSRYMLVLMLVCLMVNNNNNNILILILMSLMRIMMLMTMVLEGTTSRHGVSITWIFLLLLLLMLLMLISMSLDGSNSLAHVVNVDGFGSLGGDVVTDYSVLMVMVVVVQKTKLRCEMYTEILSPSFVGMTFNQASVLCFSKVLKSLFV